MRKAVINISLYDKSFTSEFEIAEKVQEYEIADEAYRLALMFANTQVIALFGHRVSGNKFAEILGDLNYEYTIVSSNELTQEKEED